MTAEALLERYAEGKRDFREMSLVRADLNHAYLDHVDLRGADLRRADLRGVNFSYASLRGADLSGATLIGANLLKADLRDARCAGTVLWETHITDVDLGAFCAGPIVHRGPSSVDWRSVARSLRAPGLKRFLADAGMPGMFAEFLIDCARSLDPVDLFSMMQSTFISYGSPDEPFARKLYESLHQNGVTTFFFAEHAVPGDKLHRMMRKGVNEHDRVILICSKNSLDRKGVLNEIEEVLAREARDGGSAYLIPIRLDGYVFSGWSPPSADTAQAVRDRVVADFEGTDADPAKFDAQLRRLLGALKKKPA